MRELLRFVKSFALFSVRAYRLRKVGNASSFRYRAFLHRFALSETLQSNASTTVSEERGNIMEEACVNKPRACVLR